MIRFQIIFPVKVRKLDKKEIEKLETQISIECIKVYKYLLEIETFQADGTVNEIKKWVKCLEQKAL